MIGRFISCCLFVLLVVGAAWGMVNIYAGMRPLPYGTMWAGIAVGVYVLMAGGLLYSLTRRGASSGEKIEMSKTVSSGPATKERP